MFVSLSSPVANHFAATAVVMTCEPALKLLPKIVDDHVALSIFRKAFDSEVAGMKAGEVRLLFFKKLGS